MKNQIDKSYYSFKKYMHKKRWISLWHQLDEVLSLTPSTVLELGPGPGLFKMLAENMGIAVKTADIDPELNPDHLISGTNLPYDENSYDCVCAFQVLEHLPYANSIQVFNEMARVAKNHIVISLPDAKKMWLYSFHIPIIGQVMFDIPRPHLRPLTHKFNGEHYWEINKKGYSLSKVIEDYSGQNFKIVNTYRVKEFQYHRYFVFKKEKLY